MIDLVALQSLMGIAERGSVGGAAESLGYTPSAVSQQIKRLERSLGVELLERVGRGVVLTEPARLLVSEGHRLLGELEAVESRLDSTAGKLHGPIRVAAHATAIRGIVAPALAALGESAPDLDITLIERDPADSVALLVAGQVDVAVAHNWVGVPLHVPAGIDEQPIGEDVADVLIHRSNPLSRRKSLSPKALLDQRWAVTPVGTICHAWFVQMFAGFGRTPTVRYWSPEFDSHVALVKAGVAIALVPRLGRRELPDEVVAVPVHDPVPTRQVIVLRRATMASSPAVQHITDALIAHARLRT